MIILIIIIEIDNIKIKVFNSIYKKNNIYIYIYLFKNVSCFHIFTIKLFLNVRTFFLAYTNPNEA
jgi:hypothetical protein